MTLYDKDYRVCKMKLCSCSLGLTIVFADLSQDQGPLFVYFKLPVSEISEIDDHKSVSSGWGAYTYTQ